MGDSDLTMSVHVKAVNGKNCTLELVSTTTIMQLKAATIEAMHIPETKNVRLIYRGALLSDPTRTLDAAKITDGSYVHCAISEKRAAVAPAAGVENGPAQNGEPDLEAGEARPLRGFDRLLLNNDMNQDDVTALRAVYYLPIQQQMGLSDALPNESSDDHLRRVEDDWLRAQGDNSEIALNFNLRALRPNAEEGDDEEDMSASWRNVGGSGGMAEDEGTWGDCVIGFMMGALLGFVLVFYVFLHDGTSRRQRMGILMGVGFYMLTTSFKTQANSV